MRQAAFLIVLLLACTPCLAGLDDDTLKQATAHYESMIYATVADRIAKDIEGAELSDEEEKKWLDAIVIKLASCHLDALAYLGESVQAETIKAQKGVMQTGRRRWKWN